MMEGNDDGIDEGNPDGALEGRALGLLEGAAVGGGVEDTSNIFTLGENEG